MTNALKIPREAIKMNDKVLLIFEDTKSLKKLKKSLIENDYKVSLCEINIGKIHQAIESIKPDVLVFYYKKARTEIIDIVKYIQSTTPTPITIFSDESDNKLVSDSITNGATAFIVDGIETHRIAYILDAAKARFNKCQTLKKRLDNAESKLDGGRDIDKAKEILMKSKNIAEYEADFLLKNMAMNNNMRIEDLSKNLITASVLLNNN